MATIAYYLHPAASAEIETCDTVGESLMRRWTPATVPKGLRVYRESAARENDVTMGTTELLAANDNHYVVTVEPGDPITQAIVVAVVAAVVTVALAPSPSVSAPSNVNRRQQSPNNSFGARTNQPRVNERSADVRGKQVNAYMDLWQVPYRRFVNGIEFEYLYGQASEGYCVLSDISDGATLFSRISGAKLAVYGPGTSPLSGTPQQTIGGGAPNELLYDITQSNEVTGTTLTPPNESGAQTATFSVDSINNSVTIDDPDIDFTTFLSAGGTVTLQDFYGYNPIELVTPIKYEQINLNGTFEIDSVTTDTITIVPTGGWNQPFQSMDVPTTAWSEFDGSQQVWYLQAVSGATPYQFQPTLAGIGGATSPAVNISGYERIIINIFAPRGLYKDDGTNRIPLSLTVRYTIYELDSNGIRTGNELTDTFTISSNPNNVSDTSGATAEVPYSYTNAEVTVSRVTNTDKTFSGTVVDEIKWRDLYLARDVATGDLDVSYATTIHAEIKATESALRVKERKLNYTCERLVNEYLGNGQFGAAEDYQSDLFADVVASIWRDPLFGRGADDEVNWEQLYDTQAAMITYFGNDQDPCRVGYTFDSDKITAEEAISLICRAVNVIPYRIGSVLNFWFEQPQSQSTMQFGHRFKHPGTDQRNRSFANLDDKTGIELTYFDENTGVYETVLRGDQTDPRKIELPACITARGAQIQADREWQKLRLSRITHGFDATAIGRLAVPGMRVDVVDNTRYTPYNGEVRAVDGLTLKLSQPVTLDTPTDYSIVLTRRDGTVESIGIAAQASPDTVTLDSAPSEPPQVGRDADKTAYSIGTDDMRTNLAMLIREINPKDYNKVGIACINYDDRYYLYDN